MKITGNEPAYPNMLKYGMKDGMTIRTELAARAMESLIKVSPKNDDGTVTLFNREFVAEQACKYADALIEELNKSEK